MHAATCYQRGAELGYGNAQNNLGACYEHGRGVAPDAAKAFMWYRLAAATGEEETFLRTLAAGTTFLDSELDAVKAAGSKQLAGDTAFLLHDTYGFPIDLTLEIAEEAETIGRARELGRAACSWHRGRGSLSGISCRCNQH